MEKSGLEQGRGAVVKRDRGERPKEGERNHGVDSRGEEKKKRETRQMRF